MVELPWPLAAASIGKQVPQLAPLVARSSGMDTKFRVEASDDNASYTLAAKSHDFAVYGTLGEDYGLTPLLEDSEGMVVDLPGVDGLDALDTTDETGRLSMALLIFCEDEILSYREVQVISATRVRLFGLRRACYDTLMTEHGTGVPVMILAAENLEPFSRTSYRKGAEVFLKPATAMPGAILDLSDAPLIDLVLTNRTARPLPPINLRVNGNGLNPTYQAGQDVLIEFDIASWRRHDFFDCWEEVYSDDKLAHKVRFSI